MAVSLDGRLALSGSWDMNLRVWDLDSGKQVQCCREHGVVGSYWHPVLFSRDGSRALSGHLATVRVWDVASGRELRQIELDQGDIVRCLDLSPDGHRLLIGTESYIYVWDLVVPRQVCCLTRGSRATVSSVAFSPDGRRAAGNPDPRNVHVWDLPGRNPRVRGER